MSPAAPTPRTAAGCGWPPYPEELAIITDWFTRATALAHTYLEKLNRNDPDEEC